MTFMLLRTVPELNHLWAEIISFGIGLIVFITTLLRKRNDSDDSTYTFWVNIIWSMAWMIFTAINTYQLRHEPEFYNFH